MYYTIKILNPKGQLLCIHLMILVLYQFKEKMIEFFLKKIWILFEHNLKYISKNVLLFTETFLGTFKLGRKVEPFRKDEGLFA